MAASLILIDASGFIFRAYHALPPLNRPDGTPVGAVLGFCNMLLRLESAHPTATLVAVFDAARHSFRHEIYPQYKAHRPPAPPDLVPQFALVREAAEAFGLPVIESLGFEADDLLASYAAAAQATGEPVTILSSDKDLMQLIGSGVSLMDPIKYTNIGEAEVLAKFGVPPDKVIEVQALMGDSTDNVPGVPGIGVKTAAELIQTYGSLENLLANTATIQQPKRREALEQNRDAARISYQLVQLKRDVPLPVPLAQLQRGNKNNLAAFLQQQGFKNLLTRLQLGAPLDVPATSAPVAANIAVPESITTAYELVQDEAALQRWCDKIVASGIVAIDTETTSLVPSTTQLVGISLAVQAGQACYIPLQHGTDASQLDFAAERPKQLPLALVVEHLKPLLQDAAILKIGHNLKFDMQVLAQHGLKLNSCDDTLQMSYVLAAGLHNHALDDLALRFLNVTMLSYNELTGSGKNRITFAEVPLDKALAYAAADADITLRLWHLFKPQLQAQGLLAVYEYFERPLGAVLAEMESAGILIDAQVLADLSHNFAQRLAVLEEKIHKLAGSNFNVASPKQLGEVLFEQLKLPGGTKGKNGAYSTDAEVLENLASAGHAIAEELLLWRGLAKLRSTYTEALPKAIQAKTGRVHTSFSLVGAQTGRLSSSEPNLQNIPIRSSDGRDIRRAFVAASGHVLLSADYSQIELRIVADMAGIPALKQAFADGIDIHSLTASEVLGVPLAEVSADQRRQAKAINFGIIYGISGFGLAKQLGCSAAEANQFIARYFARFPELKDYMTKAKEQARAQGFVSSYFGRRIHLPGIADKNAARRNFAERQAINAPIQGTAADIIKLAMIALPPALQKAGLAARMLLQVHDELLFEVPKAEAAATIDVVKDIMQNVARLSVPLLVEAKCAANWAEAH